ncbi:MAG: hypothetical protein KGZ58_08030 [Ignavibacteriales bacterium]|nr:hypothetical protein [Ignavibacteriales bacterium]
MNIKELNKSQLPIVRIDDSLEEYKDKVLFPDKLENANATLRIIGLPKIKKQTKRSHSFSEKREASYSEVS